LDNNGISPIINESHYDNTNEAKNRDQTKLIESHLTESSEDKVKSKESLERENICNVEAKNESDFEESNKKAQYSKEDIDIRNDGTQYNIEKGKPDSNLEKRYHFGIIKLRFLGYYQGEDWEKYFHEHNDSSEIYISLNINTITDDLSTENKYESDKIKLKFSGLNFNEFIQKEDSIYLAQLKNEFSYSGFLNKNFQRSNIGRNDFTNKDIYLGNWRDDKKTGYGIYLYYSEEEKAITQLYAGNFHSDGKKFKGFYFNNNNKPFKDGITSFTSYSGVLDENENLEYGVFLNQADEKYKSYIYVGKFTDNKKNDINGYYYLYESGLLYIGKLELDEIINGYIYEVTSSKKIKSVVKYNSSNNLKEVIQDLDHLIHLIEIGDKFLSKTNPNELVSKSIEITRNSLELEENYKIIYSDEQVDPFIEALGHIDKQHSFYTIDNFP